MTYEEFVDMEPVYKVIIGHRRWNVDYYKVVEVDGKYYGGMYDLPATESQIPSWNDDDEIDLEEVEPHFVYTVQYIPVHGKP